MVQGRWGVDEDDAFDGILVCEKDLCGAEGDDAAKGPAWRVIQSMDVFEEVEEGS